MLDEVVEVAIVIIHIEVDDVEHDEVIMVQLVIDDDEVDDNNVFLLIDVELPDVNEYLYFVIQQLVDTL